MFTAKGSILLHPILGTHTRHRTVNFSYFFSANNGSSENDKTLVFGTGRGSTRRLRGPTLRLWSPFLTSYAHILA